MTAWYAKEAGLAVGRDAHFPIKPHDVWKKLIDVGPCQCLNHSFEDNNFSSALPKANLYSYQPKGGCIATL